MRRSLPALAVALLLTALASTAIADSEPNPCLEPTLALSASRAGDEEGIGGTGLVPSDEGGVGGTGIAASDTGGIGGTGIAASDTGGIGGTGIAASDTGGIGGTGIAASDTGGIGGTGLEADDFGVGGTGIAASDAGGIGGTGIRGEDDGIGGTGIRGEDDGIGGTGIRGEDDGIGGTGIRGTITRFGSICVNGLRVHYDSRVPMLYDHQPAPASDLRIGQVVWVEAHSRDGRLVAERIEVESALRGRVRAVDPVAGVVDVDGMTVELSDGALVLDGAGLAALDVDSPVEVFGLPDQSGRLVASRIDSLDSLPEPSQPEHLSERLRRAPHLRSLSIEGFVPGNTGEGLIEIEGLDVDLGPLAPAARALVPGARVWVRGHLDGSRTLRAEELSVRSTRRGWRPQARLRQQRVGAAVPAVALLGGRPPGAAVAGAGRAGFLGSARRLLKGIFGGAAVGASAGPDSAPAVGAAAHRATRLVHSIERSSGAERKENVRRLARFMRRLVRDDQVQQMLRDPEVRQRFRRTAAGRQLLSYPRVRRALDPERRQRPGAAAVGAASAGRVERLDRPERPRREKRPERQPRSERAKRVKRRGG